MEPQQRSVTDEDIQARLASGQQRFAHVEDVLFEVKHALEQVIKGQDELRETIRPISDDIAQIKDMVGAWKAIGSAGRFAKWLGGIATGLVALWIVMKAGAKALVGGL